MSSSDSADGAASTENLGRERGIDLFIVHLIFALLALAFTLLRAYVKVTIVKKTTPDDWLMYSAMCIYIAHSVIDLHAIVVGGTGKHTVNLTPQGAAIALRSWYLCEVLYPPMSGLIRTSIAVFLLRIATNKYHRWIIYGNLAVVWILTIAYFVVMAIQCSPPSYFWEQVLGAEGNCIHQDIVPNATIAHSVIGCVCDWVFGLLPIAMLWNVKLNRRTKAGIAILLSAGIIAGIALLVRIPYIRFLSISEDFLYETIDVAIWSVLEPSLGIIAGCAAALRPLFKAWGLGPRSSKNYINEDAGLNYKGPPGWTTSRSRGARRLSDKPSSNSLGKSETSSDIELHRSAQSPGVHAVWSLDIEGGQGSPAPGAWNGESHPSGIRVQTSINVETEAAGSSTRKDSEDSDSLDFALSGRLSKPEPTFKRNG